MDSDLRKKMMSRGLPPLGHLSASISGPRKHDAKNFTPLPWSDFFDEKLKVTTDKGCIFNVYTKGKVSNLIVVMLHGGGYSGLTWACLSVRAFIS